MLVWVLAKTVNPAHKGTVSTPFWSVNFKIYAAPLPPDSNARKLQQRPPIRGAAQYYKLANLVGLSRSSFLRLQVVAFAKTSRCPLVQIAVQFQFQRG